MARRSFRWCPERKEMVEITQNGYDPTHFVRGDIAPFKSIIDGTVIDSRAKLADHCARHNVVPHSEVQGATKEYDRYESARQDRALREQLWERVDKAMHRRR